jgi:hypothetical protein
VAAQASAGLAVTAGVGAGVVVAEDAVHARGVAVGVGAHLAGGAVRAAAWPWAAGSFSIAPVSFISDYPCKVNRAA